MHISQCSSFAGGGLLWQQRKCEFKVWNMRCYTMLMCHSVRTPRLKQTKIFLKNILILSRWATWSLKGLSGKNQDIVKAEHLHREPQPMRWNEITDGDTERKDAVPRRHVTLTGSRGRLSGPVSPDCTDLFLFPRPHEYLSSSVVNTNLMRYRRSLLPSFFEEFTASSHCLLVM